MAKPIITCQHCDNIMKKTVRIQGGCAAQLISLGLFLTGLALSLTVAGAIIGVPMMLASMFFAKTEKVWMCKGCKHWIHRG